NCPTTCHKLARCADLWGEFFSRSGKKVEKNGFGLVAGALGCRVSSSAELDSNFIEVRIRVVWLGTSYSVNELPLPPDAASRVMAVKLIPGKLSLFSSRESVSVSPAKTRRWGDGRPAWDRATEWPGA